LKKNPKFMIIECSTGWLEGFYDRLRREELHPADWDHLEELKAWHEQQRELMGDEQTTAT